MNLNININPNQQQPLPGAESQMESIPIHDNLNNIGSGKLKDKVAIITG